MQNLISICIPAYKRTAFLKRLLDSIIIQTYKNFEVIVTDDSPGNDVKELCNQYKNLITLFYYHNDQQLGTPENWNEAIRKAKGEWIKLMHDDDWFVNENSLTHFAETVQKNPSSSFIFSAYSNVYPDNKTKDIFVNACRYKMLCKNAVTLFSENIIGPPSCVIFKKNNNILFDSRFQWVVDFDFYIRYLSVTKPVYIKKALVNIGISDTQVTRQSFRNPKIEIPENFLLLEKVGEGVLKNVFVFDAWWRLIRNLGIKDIGYIKSNGYNGHIKPKISAMIKFQNKIPKPLLHAGIFSKFFMFICFCSARLKRV
jgi:glycosyltransferase involved in cell wall biosynthesis